MKNGSQHPCDWLRSVVERNRSHKPVGTFSVCSANSWVLEAAMHQARENTSVLCIESTSNQVNQFGGYTGMTPAQFADYIDSIAKRAGFPVTGILLGSDHLGPYPWRKEPAESALAKACELVRQTVLAGYSKIHLDASMACGDDPASAISRCTTAGNSCWRPMYRRRMLFSLSVRISDFR
jgi:D-tagatose-1,6-bisphosphate aldolase subunit GatZ/KbaZ